MVVTIRANTEAGDDIDAYVEFLPSGAEKPRCRYSPDRLGEKKVDIDTAEKSTYEVAEVPGTAEIRFMATSVQTGGSSALEVYRDGRFLGTYGEAMSGPFRPYGRDCKENPRYAVWAEPWETKAPLPDPKISIDLPNSSCAGKSLTADITIDNEGGPGTGTLTIEGEEASISMDAGETRTISRAFTMGTEDRTFSSSVELNEETDSDSKTVRAIMPKSRVSIAGAERWIKPGESASFDIENEQINCPSKVRIDLLRTDTGEVLDSVVFSSKAGETITESLTFEMPADRFSVRADSFVKPVGEWIKSDETGELEVFPAKTLFIDDTRGVEMYGGREITVPYTLLIGARRVEGENLEKTDRVAGFAPVFSWTGILETRGVDSVSWSNLSFLRATLEKELFVVDNGRDVGWKTSYEKTRLPAPLPHEMIRNILGIRYLPSEVR